MDTKALKLIESAAELGEFLQTTGAMNTQLDELIEKLRDFTRKAGLSQNPKVVTDWTRALSGINDEVEDYKDAFYGKPQQVAREAPYARVQWDASEETYAEDQWEIDAEEEIKELSAQQAHLIHMKLTPLWQ